MSSEKLKALIQERTLLKQLVKVNPSYLMLFNSRIAEIKMEINSAYAPIPNAEVVIFLYQKEVAEDIQKNATELLKELMEIKL